MTFPDRAVAQFGSALDWGSRGRGFKSRQPDQVRAGLSGPVLPRWSQIGHTTLPEQVTDHLRRRLVVGRDHGAVDLLHRARGVPEAGGDDLDRHPRLERRCGEAVPQAVECQPWQARGDRQAGDDTGERRRPVGGPLGPREHQRVVRAPGARPAGAHLQAVLALLDPPPAQRRDRVRVESHGGLGPRALRRRATSSRVLGISTSCRAIVAVPASRSTWPHRSAAGLRTMWPLSTASRHAALTVLCTSTLRADIGSSVASVPLPRRWTRFTPAWIKDLKEAPVRHSDSREMRQNG
jgi:hypothetical protein